MQNIQTIREQIDTIDNTVISLFSKRFSLVKKLGKIKAIFIAIIEFDLNNNTISFIFFIFKKLSYFRKDNKTVKIFIEIIIYTIK